LEIATAGKDGSKWSSQLPRREIEQKRRNPNLSDMGENCRSIRVLYLGIAASALGLPATETETVTVTVAVTLLTAKNVLPLHPWLSQMALVMNFRIMPGRTGLSYISRGKKTMETFETRRILLVFVIKSG